MPLRRRVLLSVTLILTGTIILLSTLLSWHAYASLLAQQKEDALNLARILARTTAIVEVFPQTMEEAIGEQMVVEATLTAHLVAFAEEVGLSADEINLLLQDIAQKTALSEFWITDEQGHAYLRNMTALDFTFSPDPEAQPQASEFWSLLTGEEDVVVQDAQVREVDDQSFKYVGVGGVDIPRIVQVGYDATWLRELSQQVGVARFVDQLVAGSYLQAVRVSDTSGGTLVFSATEDFDAGELSVQDKMHLERAIATEKEMTYLEGDILKVIVPIYPQVAQGREQVIGTTMVYVPTEGLQQALHRQLLYAGLFALFVLGVGMVGSFFFSNRLIRPIKAISDAATAVKQGTYQSLPLKEVFERTDELGNLGRIFDAMAVEVSARDERLNLLKKIIPMGVQLSAEKDFDRLLEMMVIEAQKVTNADGGSLYLREENYLRFMVLRNNSLNITMGGDAGDEMTFPPLPLYKKDGQENLSNVAAYATLRKERVHIADAYDAEGFDFSGTRRFDETTGYRSQSFLTFPLLDEQDEVIGVLQLINALDAESGEIVPFASDEVIESLALLTSAALAGYIRAEKLRQEIQQLRIEIDRQKEDEQVAEITESEYFKNLQAKAKEVRRKKEEGLDE